MGETIFDLGMRCRATGCIAYKHTHLQTLSFIKREELVAFTVVVNTYYQLLVDANAIIMEGSLKPPERWFKVGENGGSLSPPISLPVCLSVCLSVCLFIFNFLSVCLFILWVLSSVLFVPLHCALSSFYCGNYLHEAHHQTFLVSAVVWRSASALVWGSTLFLCSCVSLELGYCIIIVFVFFTLFLP